MIDPDISINALEAYRKQADPVADTVVAKIMASGSGRSIGTLFNDLITNDDYSKVGLPEEVAQYFKDTAGLPSWADQTKIKKGQEVFAQFGPEICLLLMCKSLPEAYACKKGALVMYQTGRMQEGPDGSLERFTRRLMETSQFVVNVCSPEGFSETGAGLITAQKVRLIHATIRYYILQAGKWDSKKNGVPINQEDLAGTLQSFSSLILEGVAQLGVTLSPDQIEGYFHCWRIAGHVIGLVPELNPFTYEEGLKLGYKILNHQKAASEPGVVLTNAVSAFMEKMMPGNLFDETPHILIRYFVGDKTADLLSVPEEKDLLAKVLPKLLKILFQSEETLENHSELYKKLARTAALKMLQGMLNYFNDYKGVHFYLPPSLKGNWKLDSEWETTAHTPNLGKYRIAIEKKKSTL